MADAALPFVLPSRLTSDRLQAIVDAVCRRLTDPELRAQSQRAIQAKVWHLEPGVSMLMRELKADELQVKNLIEQRVSALVYEFHSHTIDATLARAGITTDDRFAQPAAPATTQPPSGASSSAPGDGEASNRKSVMDPTTDLDLRCLDAKERLYMLLQRYGWLEGFFRTYPHHFYENSFSFVSRIPPKPLLCRALVLGLGVGGSMACSGVSFSCQCKARVMIVDERAHLLQDGTSPHHCRCFSFLLYCTSPYPYPPGLHIRWRSTGST
jgi:hypothetical protein